MLPKTAYDGIAADYQKSKELPFRTYAEAPLLATLLGDLKGKRVLDLACGEGIYARKLKRNYYLARETYARVTSAYFRQFNWRVPAVTAAGMEALGVEYWREFAADPPVIGFEAQV